jgi:hypothetical protein
MNPSKKIYILFYILLFTFLFGSIISSIISIQSIKKINVINKNGKYISATVISEEQNNFASKSFRYKLSYYFNNKNGVYIYKNGYLSREDNELLSYDIIDSVSYYVRLGNNKDKQFKLYRNSNGYYPLYNTNNSLEFYEFTNKILRTKLDYNNAFDISYNDVLYEDLYEINLDID